MSNPSGSMNVTNLLPLRRDGRHCFTRFGSDDPHRTGNRGHSRKAVCTSDRKPTRYSDRWMSIEI